MLEDLEKLFTWARIRLKPTKSRSLVVRRGKLVKTVFRIKKTIPAIQEIPIKGLVQWFNESICDTESIAEMLLQTNE